MVCKLPSARSLSKARSEGALRENMANADISASAKAMSPWSRRGSGMVAKPLRTKGKSASAERCLRALGATMAMGNPITRTSHRSSPGVFSHQCLRKASAADTVITGLGGSAGIAEDYLTLEQLGSLEGLYRTKNLTVQFRGRDYLAVKQLQKSN